jgi:hypothetical protein
MMPALLSVLLLGPAAPPPARGELVAIRVKRAETIANGPLEHALILVEDGKIIEIGEDLPVERGIRVLERPDWIATPGLVNAHSRAGLERSQGRGADPHLKPTPEIDPRSDTWAELLELGVTTIGIYPDGGGIPGQAIALRPYGKSVDEMIVADPAYLKVSIGANASSKKALREGFEKADAHEAKVAKEREKWEKEQEKKKKPAKSSSSKKDDEKKDEPPKDEKSEKSGAAQAALQEKDEAKKDDKKAGDEAFVPPAPDEKVAPFLALRAKTLTAMMSIRKAADYLHLLDVIEDEKDVQWFLHFSLGDDGDLYEVAQKIGERKLLVVTEPEVTLQVNSLRERNVPAELARAGAKLAFVPRFDARSGIEEWRHDVGRLVAQGLAREVALAGLTLEPARALGLAERLGSLEKEKLANIVFWSADPLEPDARVVAVMLDGEFVVGDVK